jgi:hypothetical protein
MDRDSSDDQSLLDKAKDMVTTILGGRDTEKPTDTGTGVVDYNRAAGVDTSMSDAREGVAMGDFGIAGQTDAYDGADVVADQADTPERHDLD